jgi:glycosyltransferase involved in cell wall biosynthesis
MITIITAALNAFPALQSTFESISNQKRSDWQWIIVDGASTDGTADWLHDVASQHQNINFISELDNGIYDAWNKALPLIKGDWVVFLGAGDKFKSSNTLADISFKLNEVSANVNLAYGRIEFIDEVSENSGQLFDAKWEGVTGRWAYCRPMLPAHQSIFHRAEIFHSAAAFDSSYAIAGDTALLLKEFLSRGGIDLGETTSLVLKGGVSANPKHRLKMLWEVLRANREAGLGTTRLCYQYTAFFYHALKIWARRV